MIEPFFRDPRTEDPDYLTYIRQHPCCVCGDNVHVEAAHLRVGSINAGKQPAGMQLKSSDRWALPLCSSHHRQQHRMNEMEFWASWGIDPFALAMQYQRRR